MHLENSGLGIMHMEFDLFIPDNLLYMDGHSLKTLNMSSMTGHLISGLTKINGLKDGVGSEARFHHPYSFFQYNSTYVVIADAYNYCLRSVDRLTNQTSWVAGGCGSYDYADGSFSHCRFSVLQKMVRVPHNDSQHNVLLGTYSRFWGIVRIRTIKFDENSVYTLDQWFWKTRYLFAVRIRPHTTTAYFTCAGGFGKIDYSNGDNSLISPIAVKGFRDGSFHLAVFSGKPESLTFLNQDTMIITDYENHLLRIGNLNSKVLSSICDWQQGEGGDLTKAGNISDCKLVHPRSILALPEKNMVMIGSQDSLGYMIVKGKTFDRRMLTDIVLFFSDDTCCPLVQPMK